MKAKLMIVAAVLTALAAAACGDTSGTAAPTSPSTPVTEPSTPPPTSTPADTRAWTRGPAFVSGVQVLQLESFPVQVVAEVSGDLPTPCHQARWDLAEPDADGRIVLDVYSIADPGQICIQVLEPFTARIPVGDFTDGSFVLVVNGEEHPFSIG